MTGPDYAIAHDLTPFISMQNHYNLAYPEEEREMMPTLKHFSVSSIPWSPLAHGYAGRPPTSDDTSRGGTDTYVFYGDDSERIANKVTPRWSKGYDNPANRVVRAR